MARKVGSGHDRSNENRGNDQRHCVTGHNITAEKEKGTLIGKEKKNTRARGGRIQAGRKRAGSLWVMISIGIPGRKDRICNQG